MKILIPAPALGNLREVTAQMTRWISQAGIPVPMSEVDGDQLCILRNRPRTDRADLIVARMPAFEQVLLRGLERKGFEFATTVVNQLLDANSDPWWAPYLFESYGERLYVPVAERLFANSCLHWDYVKSLGKIFLYGGERRSCDEMGFPFAGYGALVGGRPVKRERPILS